MMKTSRPQNGTIPGLLAALLLLSALPGRAAETGPDAGEILRKAREAYSKLSGFREHGTIEITGTEKPWKRLFELESGDGELTFVLAEDRAGTRREMLWQSGGQFFRYGSDGDQLRPVPSMSAGLAALVGAQEGAALVVPRLLAEAGATWPGAEPPTLETSERCGAGTCWVVALTPRDGVASRLWIDKATSLIKKSELRAGAKTVIVYDQVETVDGVSMGPRMAWTTSGQTDPWSRADSEGALSEEITVTLTTATVRVVDPYGRPVTGLRPEDFRVMASGREVPVSGVDWVSATPAAPAPQGKGATADPQPVPGQAAPEETAIGKLVVFFVQANMDPSRIKGQINLREQTRKLLATLGAEDRAAVLSFDSHLKLWQDFTRDREAAHRALDHAMRFGGKDPERPAADDPESLAAHFDFQRARAAASPEGALAVAAAALGPLSGEKVVIFLGYGLGKLNGMDKLNLRSGYDSALEALGSAHASVFVLDVTQADFHTLESGLIQIAAQTGGTYAKTNLFPNLAAETLANVISGYYVLTFDRDTLPKGGTLKIGLRDPKRGTVLARTPQAPAASGR